VIVDPLPVFPIAEQTYNPDAESPLKTVFVAPALIEIPTFEYDKNPDGIVPDTVEEIAAVIAPFVALIALDAKTPLPYASPL
jgi:hypothetical protein